jgi:hypothetical protein
MKCLVAALFTAALALAELPASEAQDDGLLQPTNVSAVNSAADEVDPFVTADGKGLFFASNATGHFELMLARRTSGSWEKPRPLEEVNAPDADTRSPFLARTGQLYFATDKVPDEKFKKLRNFDLFQREGGRAPLPLLAICTRAHEMFPWVATGGREFYFSRQTEDGWRLFVAKGPAFGGVGEGKLIEELPEGFHHATLTDDGLTMYLQGPLVKARWGLFRTTRKKVGAPWAEPEPLTALNHPRGQRGDMAPCLAHIGTVLYFVSDRPGGQGGLDIWSIPTARLKSRGK